MEGWKRMTRAALAVVSALLVLAVDGALAGTMGPKEYWQKAQGYAGNKLYIDAVENYTRAIRTNKGEIAIADVARIFNSRGIAYLGLNDTEKAIDDFSNAIELDDRNPEFPLNRANAYLGRKQYERARDDFARVIALDPKSADAYAGRGKANLGSRSYASAIADYKKLRELEPRNVNALYGLGLAYKGDRQDAKAIESFNELLKIDPQFAAASYQNAGLFSRSGKIDAGCVWLEEAVANGYRDWDALKNDSDFDPLRKTGCYQKILSSGR